MNIAFTTIARGTDSGYQSASHIIIDNSERWNKLWQLHTRNAEPPPPVPRVDFTQYSVVAVFAGEKPTGGYLIEILTAEVSSAEAKDQFLIVFTVQSCQPKEDCVTEALTYPYHIIKVPKIDGNKVVFQHI